MKRKAILIGTDAGLVVYWVLTAVGIVSVGGGHMLSAWNWSFLPLDSLAAVLGLTWSLVPRGSRWSTPLLAAALALTHAAGLMAISFLALWGTWAAAWWIVNLWLTLMPVVVVLTALHRSWLGAAPRSREELRLMPRCVREVSRNT